MFGFLKNLFSCDTKPIKKFKYGDKVIVTCGFYEGQKGKVERYLYRPWPGGIEVTAWVRLKNNDLIFIHPNILEKVEIKPWISLNVDVGGK